MIHIYFLTILFKCLFYYISVGNISSFSKHLFTDITSAFLITLVSIFGELFEIDLIDRLFSHSELTDPCNDSVLVMGEHAGHTSQMLYGTTIMQTLSKVYRALPHAVYTFRVNQLYRVYRVYVHILLALTE